MAPPAAGSSLNDYMVWFFDAAPGTGSINDRLMTSLKAAAAADATFADLIALV